MPSPPDRLIRLAVGDVTVVVDLDEGARGVEWTVAGHQLLAHYGDRPIEHGMYPMAPWAGRIRDNTVTWSGQAHALPVTHDPWAIHGMVLTQSASVIDLTQDAQDGSPRRAHRGRTPAGRGRWPSTSSGDCGPAS